MESECCRVGTWKCEGCQKLFCPACSTFSLSPGSFAEASKCPECRKKEGEGEHNREEDEEKGESEECQQPSSSSPTEGVCVPKSAIEGGPKGQFGSSSSLDSSQDFERGIFTRSFDPIFYSRFSPHKTSETPPSRLYQTLSPPPGILPGHALETLLSPIHPPAPPSSPADALSPFSLSPNFPSSPYNYPSSPLSTPPSEPSHTTHLHEVLLTLQPGALEDHLRKNKGAGPSILGIEETDPSQEEDEKTKKPIVQKKFVVPKTRVHPTTIDHCATLFMSVIKIDEDEDSQPETQAKMAQPPSSHSQGRTEPKMSQASSGSPSEAPDSLDDNVALQEELRGYEDQFYEMSLSPSNVSAYLNRADWYIRKFKSPHWALPSIETTFLAVRKKLSHILVRSPHLVYRTIAKPRNKNVGSPLLRKEHSVSAPSFTTTEPSRGADLFRGGERENTLFYFVPGIYSGKVPGSADSPDIFKIWFNQVEEALNLDCRYPENYPVDGKCEDNAQFLRTEIETLHSQTGKRVVLVCYSKGSADALSALVLNRSTPFVEKIVCGVISVCGAFGGSPLASVMTSDYLYIRGIVQLVIERQLECNFGALMDVTLEHRDFFLTENSLPSASFPFPIISVIGTISGIPTDPFYPLYKFIKRIHGSQSDGVVSCPDQTIPGSMTIIVPGLNHTVPLKDPVPFWGSLFWCILNCQPETHDETKAVVYAIVKGAEYRMSESEEFESEPKQVGILPKVASGIYHVFSSSLNLELRGTEAKAEAEAEASPSPSSSPPPQATGISFLSSGRSDGDFFVKLVFNSQTEFTTSFSQPSVTKTEDSEILKSAKWDEGTSFSSTVSSISTDVLSVFLYSHTGLPGTGPVLLMRKDIPISKMVDWKNSQKLILVEEGEDEEEEKEEKEKEEKEGGEGKNKRGKRCQVTLEVFLTKTEKDRNR